MTLALFYLSLSLYTYYILDTRENEHNYDFIFLEGHQVREAHIIIFPSLYILTFYRSSLSSPSNQFELGPISSIIIYVTNSTLSSVFSSFFSQWKYPPKYLHDAKNTMNTYIKPTNTLSL